MSRDAYMTLKVAKDRSRNYGAATEHFLGEEGEFEGDAIRRRLGSSRQFCLESAVTSPTRIDIMAIAIQAELES